MKRLNFLKLLVTILFVTDVIAIVFGVPFSLIYLVAPDKVPAGLKAAMDMGNGLHFGFLNLIIALAGFACEAYALYCLKQVLALFQKNSFFDAKVVALFRKTGTYVIWGCILVWFAHLFIPAADGTLQLNANINSATIFVAALGLLFLVLGDVFEMARKLKEENELTI